MPRTKRNTIFKAIALAMIMLLIGNGFAVPVPVYAEGTSTGSIGEIVLLPYNFEPYGYMLCDGRSLPISQYDALYALIGTTYGGDGVNTFNLPKLSAFHDPDTASLLPEVRYFICVEGEWGFSEGIMSQIILAPDSLARVNDGRTLTLCNGRLMNISQNTALFSLLGTNFGGDGRTNFGIPNLTGMSPLVGYEYYIVHSGVFPNRDSFGSLDPLVGAIGLYACNFAATATPYARGQLLSIGQNTALYSLLMLQFGGDGRTTFALPDLEMASPLPYLNYHIQLYGVYPNRQ